MAGSSLIGALRVTLSADTAQFQQGMNRAQRQASQSAANISRTLGGIQSSLRNMAGAIGVGFGAAGAVAASRSYLQLADAAKTMEASLRLATAQSGNFAQAQDDVRRIATATHSGLKETSDLYAAFMRNSAELGISQEQAARATQTLVQTFSISGASADEAANATRQFMQALQSGTLRGDEFNSVMENAPRLARLLADSLGKSVGELRAMAEAGQLTGSVLTRALIDPRFTDPLDAEFRQLPVTFEQAMNNITTAATTAIGAFDAGGRFSNSLVSFGAVGVSALKDIENKAEETGIIVRSIFAGLDNVFDPLGENAADVFGTIRELAASARNDIGMLLGLWDSAAAGLRNIVVTLGAGANVSARENIDRMLPAATPTAPAFRAATEESERRGRLDAETRRVNDRLNNRGFSRHLADPQTYDMNGNPRRPTSPRRPQAPGGRGGRDANRQTGRRLTGPEADALLRSIGATVTSGRRSAERNRAVGGAANSYHLSDRARDIAKTPGMSLARIRQAFASRGVQISELLDEGDHFHVAWGGRGGGRGDAERQAREAEQRRREALRDEHSFNSRLRDHREAVLREQMEQAGSSEQRAVLEAQMMAIEREQYEADLRLAVALGDLSEARSQQLLDAYGQVEAARRTRLELERSEENARDSAEIAQSRLDVQIDQARQESGLARTAAERRAVELRILDLQHEQERIRLNAIIADRQSTEAARAEAVLRRDGLDTARAGERQQIIRATMGPLESFVDEIPDSAARANEALHGIAANGLASLSDGLAEAIVNVRGLGDAFDVFRNIALSVVTDLLRMQIQRQVTLPLGNALMGMLGGAGAGVKGAGGLAATASAILSAVPKRQFGGPVVPGRTYLIGENGPEFMRAGSHGYVHPINDNDGGRGGLVRVRIETDTDMFRARVAETAGVVVEHAAPGIARRATAETLSALRTPGL